MALIDIDVIKYNPETDDAIAWKFPREDISLGAQLIVNESQEAIFLKDGKVMDPPFGPGRHELSTENVPWIRGIVRFAFGGRTPNAAEVWYVNKTVMRGLKWGTKSPLQVVDPQYKHPMSVRAFGSWGMRVTVPRNFMSELIGAQTLPSSEGYIGSKRIEEYFDGVIVQRFSDALAKFFVERNLSFFETNARLNDLSTFTADAINPEFQPYGIEIVNFNVERISIPKEEQKDFQDIFNRYRDLEQVKSEEAQLLQKFEIDKIAAANPGQLLVPGLGIGASVPIAQQINSPTNSQPQPDNPTESDPNDPVARLQQLKEMLDNELITEEDFNEKKKQILEAM